MTAGSRLASGQQRKQSNGEEADTYDNRPRWIACPLRHGIALGTRNRRHSSPFKALYRSKRRTIVSPRGLNHIVKSMTQLQPLEVAQWQGVERFEKKRASQRRFQLGLPTMPLPDRIGRPPLPNVKCRIRGKEFPKAFSSGRNEVHGE